jgi:hypothetical protein
MRLSTFMRSFPSTRILPRIWRAGHKELFAQMREYLTAAKKEYLANDTAEGLVQPMRAAFSSFDGDVLLHHPLRFLFPKSQNIQPESAVA